MPRSNNNNINIIINHSSINKNDRVKKSKNHKRSKLPKTHKCTIGLPETNTIIKAKKPKKTRKTYLETNYQLISLLDRVVYEWFQRAQRLIETGTITNEMFLQKAHEFKQIFGIQYFVTDSEWVWNFRKKYNITNLDMTMLRIDNDNRPLLSVDMNDIVVYVLENNAIMENYSHTPYVQCCDITESVQTILDSSENLSSHNNIHETILPHNFSDKTAEVKLDEASLPVITDDEQARRYLKPLEDYVLLKENFRAIGLISQLEDIFSKASNK